MTLDQGHDTFCDNGQKLCEILARSNLAVWRYTSLDTHFGYVCTMTLTSEMWPWVKIMTQPWVMDNNNYYVKYHTDPTWQWEIMARTRIFGMCAPLRWPWRYDLHSRSWHTLGSLTPIVSNIIQIGQGGMKLWPGQDVNRRTDGWTDRVIPINPKLCLRGGGYKNSCNFLRFENKLSILKMNFYYLKLFSNIKNHFLRYGNKILISKICPFLTSKIHFSYQRKNSNY